MLLHGVIDSPDIPLNVSRSYLQGDPNVKKLMRTLPEKLLISWKKYLETKEILLKKNGKAWAYSLSTV